MSTEQVEAADPAPPGRIERKRGKRIQEILATAAATRDPNMTGSL